MFDTNFLQLVVFGVVGAMLVGPKDLPIVARKFGGLLGKGVGFISRTRSSVQSFIKDNQLTHVQQDFERSLQQIRQVQDEVKQGLTSPIVQSTPLRGEARLGSSSFGDPAQMHSFLSPPSSRHLAHQIEFRSPLGEVPQASHAMYVSLTYVFIET